MATIETSFLGINSVGPRFPTGSFPHLHSYDLCVYPLALAVARAPIGVGRVELM